MHRAVRRIAQSESLADAGLKSHNIEQVLGFASIYLAITLLITHLLPLSMLIGDRSGPASGRMIGRMAEMKL